MAARFVARRDAGDLKGEPLVIEQRHDPANGADESDAALSRPVHALRKRRFEDQLRQSLGKDRAGGSSRSLPYAAVFLRLAIGVDFQLIWLQTLLLGET